jgi:hypothetical protein
MASSMSVSVLQRATRADVRREPFPHLVIENALPDALADALIKEYPRLEALGVDPSENNARWSHPADLVAASPDISPVWKELIAYHASPEFFHDVVALFGEDIVRLYPKRFPTLDRLRAGRVGMRLRDSFASHDYLMDAQISGNTPVYEESSVKTTHVDSPWKLFSGLYYLRDPKDDSVGGDLTVDRFKPGLSRWQWRRRFDGVYVADDRVEPVATVRYARNTLMMFVNSLDSLHGVTVRAPTSHLRLFMNLVCEVEEPLFDVPQALEVRLANQRRVAMKRLRKLVGS